MKSLFTNRVVTFFIVAFFLFLILFLAWQGKYHQKLVATAHIRNNTTASVSLPAQSTNPYEAYNFNFNQQFKNTGLSKKQIEEHITLYRGYVKKRNEIYQALKTANRADTSRTYSPFRELKVEETYAVNGQLLHQLYFENIQEGGSNTMGPLTKKLIIDSFGSAEKFKEDFFASGECSRGWVITAYGLDDKKLHNYVLDEHNQNVPILALPILVLDVYEHAYMIDFGIKRNPYLDLFWRSINWDTVENRVKQWVLGEYYEKNNG